MSVTPIPARFLTPLRLEDIDGHTMSLIDELKFYSADLRMVVKVTPPFVTDFASIPSFFYRVLPRNGKYDRAAVLHDAAYELQLRDVTGKFFPATKAEADRLFREAMQADGVDRVTRNLMYVAVRVFGRGQFQQQETA